MCGIPSSGNGNEFNVERKDDEPRRRKKCYSGSEYFELEELVEDVNMQHREQCQREEAR